MAVLIAAIMVGVASAGSRRAAVAPTNNTPPSISGSTSTGSTVTANPGAWSGTAPFNYAYAWQICDQNGNACHPIVGATSQTYRIATGDKGNTLRIQVTATNADGSKSAMSNQSAAIGAGGPTSSVAPTITGSLTSGSTATAQNGTWSGAEPIAFTYQWQICDQNGNACHPISGATSQAYQIQKGDAGNTLRVQVMAKNSVGSTTATSTPSAKIGSAPVSNGCPEISPGASSVAVNNINSPARLQISSFGSSPRTIVGNFRSFSLQVHVADTCGQAVAGANVYATAVPFNQVTIPSTQQTDSYGNTTLQFNRLQGFPAARHQQLMVLFVRASKPGESLLSGISTRRLISLRVNLNQNL
jgi:hypothetical protein